MNGGPKRDEMTDKEREEHDRLMRSLGGKVEKKSGDRRKGG